MKRNLIVIIVIFVLIMLSFSVKYTINLNNKLIEINGTTYALTLDGKNVTEIPSTGNYYLADYDCENGSIVTWDVENHDLYISETNTNEDSCNLNFYSKPPLSKMEVGDYVAYVGNNGCLNGATGTTGTSDAESGNSCLGENANQTSDGTNDAYGYCEDEETGFYVYGWRIAYIEDDKVHLISAGCPECRSRSEEDSTGNAIQIADLNTAALKYCNATYADGGTCALDNSNTWAMGNDDFYKLTYHISGTGSNVTSAYGSPDCEDVIGEKRCGYNDDLIDIGSAYWIAAYETETSYYGVQFGAWGPSIGVINREWPWGFRPIIRLSSSVYVTGGSGTMDDPYEIGI